MRGRNFVNFFKRYAMASVVGDLFFETIQMGSLRTVPYYLYCRAIELGFKSYLLCKRVPIDELKFKIGHNLVDARTKCETHGLYELLTFDTTQLRELEKANDFYVAKGFECFFVTKAVVGYPDLPAIPVLESIATTLVNDLRQYCIDAA